MGQGRGKWAMGAGAWLLAALLVLCPATAGALDKVSLQLQWVHQAQFAGFYVAQDQGIYRKHGLEVTIRPGGPDINPLYKLASLDCDFATGWLSEAVVVRSREVPLVNLAQLIQRSALLLVTFKDSGIESIKDLNNRRVGMWRNQFSVPTHALFARNEVRAQEIDQRTSMAPFLYRAVDAAMAMLYNEYHCLYQAGLDLDQLKVFSFADLGLNFPEDGIYTLEDTWNERRDICRRFVAASLEGWRLAFKEEDQALASVMKRVNEANLASNRPHQRWMLGIMKKLYTHRVGLEKMGELSLKDLKQVNMVLLEQSFIPLPVEAKNFAVQAWKKP